MTNQEIAFNIIANVGTAKSLYIEIINKCEKREFHDIEKMYEEAEEYLKIAHKAHFNLIQKEAKGEDVNLTLLLIHAEDQLMNAETIKIISKKFVHIYKEELK